MSEVFPWINLKCEEITVAVYWMQNLQLLSNTGEKRCEYYTCILTHTIFSVVGLKVDPILCIPEDLLRFVKPLLCTIGLIFQKRKTLNDGGVTCMQLGHPLHMPAVPFQDEMLFCDSCDRGFHMECCDPPLSRMPKGEVFILSGFSVFPPLLSIQSLFFIDGRLGLSLSTQRSSGGLLGALHAYQIIPASLGRFAISGLQYWPYIEACNDGARTVVGYLAGNSYESHSWAQQADAKSIFPNGELTQCFSYGFSLCAE